MLSFAIISIVAYADVAELADALDLGSSVPDVQVQVLSSAPKRVFSRAGSSTVAKA